MNPAQSLTARQWAIIEMAHDVIATFDPRGQIRYLNRAGYHFFGITDLQGRHGQLETYLSPEETIKLVQGLKVALEQGYWQDECEWKTMNGGTRITSLTIVAHPAEADGGADEPYYSMISRDITERKEIERQLVVAKQAADNANELKSRFLVRMSHEIRTPLSGIMGLTHLLQRTSLNDVQRDYLRLITTSTSTMMHILNDILDFARIESDKLTIENVPFRLDDVLDRLSGTFSVLLGPKPVDMIIAADPQVPDIVHGDPVRLEQVLLNLVGNAIKFTDSGSIMLHIRPSCETDDRVTLTFSVSDTGLGMTEQQLDELFKPFMQASSQSRKSGAGSGLGLAISRALIMRMGGNGIHVDSEPGAGSTFSFALTFRAEFSSPGTHMQPAGMRVLVLEDSEAMRTHWCATLQQLGCEVRTAATWVEARNQLQAEHWDVWIADMEADDMHGESTWAEWKSTADSCGTMTLCSTSLYGRDALMSLPEQLRPAGVLLKPAVKQKIAHALLSLHDSFSASVETATTQEEIVGVKSPLQGNVLVVEDDPISRQVIVEMLTSFGLEVREAAQGVEAVHMLKEHPYHIVLLDLHLKGLSGLELIRRMRSDARWIEMPIVVISGEQDPDIMHAAAQAGMNEFIRKPVEPNELFQLLAKWLPPSESNAALARGPLETQTVLLNMQQALQRLDGKTALYMRLLERFVQEYADLPARLRHLTTSSQTEALQRTLHSFRGAAAHLGANQAARDALEVETAWRNNEPTQGKIAQLEFGLRRLLETIHDLLGQPRRTLPAAFDRKEVRRTPIDKI